MKKLLFQLCLFLCPLFLLAQSNLTKGYPTFKGGITTNSPERKLEEIRYKTQDFISENIESTFIKKYFSINDSIEFDLSYIINSKGIVNEKDIMVYTNVDFFNTKIISVLKSLPKFTPAIAVYNNNPYDFQIDFKPEFRVNSEFKFIPIRRIYSSSAEYSISPKEKSYLILAKKYHGNNFNSGIVDVILYFSTTETNELTNIRAYSIDPVFSDRVVKEFKTGDLKFKNKFLLTKDSNYRVPVSLRLFNEMKTYNEYIKTGVLRVKY